jgi:hypothetical protein
MYKIVVCILLQLVLFLPFYLIWRKDCKELGKDNLAVSLEERFFAWLVFCPIWVLVFLD